MALTRAVVGEPITASMFNALIDEIESPGWTNFTPNLHGGWSWDGDVAEYSLLGPTLCAVRIKTITKTSTTTITVPTDGDLSNVQMFDDLGSTPTPDNASVAFQSWTAGPAASFYFTQAGEVFLAAIAPDISHSSSYTLPTGWETSLYGLFMI